MPSIANAALDSPWIRRFMSRFLGMTDKRPLPHYTRQRFDHWFAKRASAFRVGRDSVEPLPNGSAELRPTARGEVIFWDDTFVRYHEPHVGIAAVKVLEAIGFKVSLVKDRKCCGRPAFSQGNLEAAAKMGQHNLDLLRATEPNAPVLFLEPSCYSMFVEDYRELKLPDTESVVKRCCLFEKFVDDLLEREPDALRFNNQPRQIVIHAHCHAKALTQPGYMARLVGRLPGRKATLLDTGCCGMAGAFGALDSKYELSLKVAAPLVQQIEAQPDGTVVVASGTSCRHQIGHLTPAHPKHMAELLADALVDRPF
jgi:Fe-S oxidoreductase